MEKELEIIDGCAENARNISISEETKALLLCRARLSDIFNNVAEIYYHKYAGDLEDRFQGFIDAHISLDNELMAIISTFIEVNSLDSDYKMM